MLPVLCDVFQPPRAIKFIDFCSEPRCRWKEPWRYLFSTIWSGYPRQFLSVVAWMIGQYWVTSRGEYQARKNKCAALPNSEPVFLDWSFKNSLWNLKIFLQHGSPSLLHRTGNRAKSRLIIRQVPHIDQRFIQSRSSHHTSEGTEIRCPDTTVQGNSSKFITEVKCGPIE